MKPETDDNIIHVKISPVYERRIAFLENLMVVECDFKNGPMENSDPPHSHPHEQITYVAEGELLFFKGEKEYHLRRGDMITVSSGILHCIQTISNHVRLIDSFHPVRKDFLKQ
jgi:quercetin dioxygenase-like cupin family protein